MPKATSDITISKAVLLQNTQGGPTVFHDPKSQTEVTWEGYQDSMGRDVQPVPAFYLEDINFQRVLNKGILVVVDAPPEILDLVEAQLDNPILERQRRSWIAERDAKAGVGVDSIEHTQNNDYVVVSCIGPDHSGRGQCTNQIPQQGNKVPLCSEHQDLAKFAVEHPTGQIVDGKETTVWALTLVEAPTR